MALTEEQLAELEQMRKEDAEAAGPKVPVYESVLQGAAQNLGFGFGDEILSGIEALSPNVTYEEALEENRGQVRKAQESNPNAYLTGQVLGGVAAAAPLAAAAPAMGVLKTIGTETGLGALQGGLSAAGTSEKELTDPDFYKEVATGTGVGALAGGVGAGLGKAVGAIGGKIRGVSEEAADAIEQIGKHADDAKAGLATATKGADDLIDELDDFADDIPFQYDTKSIKVDPTKADERLASFGKYVTEKPEDAAGNIAYLKTRPKEALFGPDRIHLDPNKPNNFQKMVLNDFKETGKRMKGYEKATDEILDGVELSKSAVLAPFRSALGKITGKFYDPSNEGAATVLLKYLNGDEAEVFQGLLQAPDKIDARQIRQFIRDMRSGNVQAYKGGAELRIKPRVLKQVAEELNDAMKAAIKKSKGGAEARKYTNIMKDYAEDTGSFVTLKKVWKFKPGSGPEAETWYNQGAIYPIQKIVDGDRSGASAVAKSLLHIGKKNGNDYLKVVKDNFVLDELFPELSSGIDRGTATRTWSRAANASLKGMQGSPVGAAKEVAGAAVDASSAVRRDMLKKILQGQKGISSSTEAFVSGVKDVAESAKKPLLDLGVTAGKIGESGERVLHGAGMFGARGMSLQEPEPQEKRSVGALDMPANVDSRTGLSAPESSKGFGRERQSATQKQATLSTPSTRQAPYPTPSKMGKYSRVLQRAKDAGDASLSSTHYILSQRDPEYRRLFVAAQRGDEE